MVEIDGLLTGLVVDSAREVLKVSRQAIEAPPELLTGSVGTRFIRGVAKAGKGERLIIVLNMKEGGKTLARLSRPSRDILFPQVPAIALLC